MEIDVLVPDGEMEPQVVEATGDGDGLSRTLDLEQPEHPHALPYAARAASAAEGLEGVCESATTARRATARATGGRARQRVRRSGRQAQNADVRAECGRGAQDARHGAQDADTARRTDTGAQDAEAAR